MIQEILKEIQRNPLEAQRLQQALSSRLDGAGARPNTSAATTTATVATSIGTDHNDRGALLARIAALEERNARLSESVFEWKAIASTHQRKLLAWQQRSFAAAITLNPSSNVLDAFSTEALPPSAEEDDEGLVEEDKSAGVRWRSGSDLQLPDSRRGRRLDVASFVAGTPLPRNVSAMLSTGASYPMPIPSAHPSHQTSTSAAVRRQGPRTPSQTQADRAQNMSSYSRSVAIGSTPGAPPPAPAPVRTVYAAERPPQHHTVPVVYRNGAAYVSPAPIRPPSGPAAHHVEHRSGAQARSNLGGSEAVSRGASSAASSVGGMIRRFGHGGTSTRSPTPTNPIALRTFIVSGLDSNEKQRLSIAISRLPHAVLVDCGNAEPLPDAVTHVVTRGAIRSFKGLCGLVSGKFVVPPEYVYSSAEQGAWDHELNFTGSVQVPSKPLMGITFLVSIDDGTLRDLVEKVIRYGGGFTTMHGAKSQHAAVVVLTSAQELLDFIWSHQPERPY